MKKIVVALAVMVASLAVPLTANAPAHASSATEVKAMDDANDLAIALDVYFGTTGQWPKRLDAATLHDMGVTLSKGNVVRRYRAGVPMQHAGGDIYRFCIINKRVGGWSNYESYDFGITAHSPQGRRCSFPK